MKPVSYIAAAAIALMGAPASAQFLSEGEEFVRAVRNGDAPKALQLIQSRGSIVNARDGRGQTALIAAITGRDDVWTSYLLQKGADPNLAASNGETPLIAAARIGFTDAVGWLLTKGAKIDGANRMGETALIVAVQQRHAPVVKLLLERGANPDKADSAAGYSARDYAKRDPRARDILAMIEANQPKSEKIDDFRLR